MFSYFQVSFQFEKRTIKRVLFQRRNNVTKISNYCCFVKDWFVIKMLSDLYKILFVICADDPKINLLGRVHVEDASLIL